MKHDTPKPTPKQAPAPPREAPPVIESDRFALRPLRASDKALIELHCADPRVARMTTRIPHPLPPGLADSVIARATAPDRTEEIWAMDASPVGEAEVVGLIALERMDRNQSEVSYWVIPAFWNTGFASEAVRALVEANPLGNRTMFASVFQDNPASARVLTNCGFDYIGDAESFSVARDTTVPTWTYIRQLG